MSARTSIDTGREQLEYRYTTWDGKKRRVLVGVDSIEHTGAWSVYDVPVGGTETHGWVVERLDGSEDKLVEAVMLAAAYTSDQQRYHDGERGDHAKADPLPRPVLDEQGRHQPVRLSLSAIARHARYARQQAAPAPEPIAA